MYWAPACMNIPIEKIPQSVAHSSSFCETSNADAPQNKTAIKKVTAPGISIPPSFEYNNHKTGFSKRPTQIKV